MKDRKKRRGGGRERIDIERKYSPDADAEKM